MVFGSELLGHVCSVEVEGKSTTAAGFLAFRCSADRKKSPVVVPCNWVNCSMRRFLSATSSFNFSMRDFFAKASSLSFRCLTCSRRSFSSSGGGFPSSERWVSSGPVQ